MQTTKVVPQHPPEFNIHTGCGLIEDENVGVVYQRLGNLEAALHSSGQLPNLGIALSCKSKLLQKPFDGGRSFFLSDSVVSRLEVEEFFDGEEPVAGEVLRRNADLRTRVTVVPNDVFTEDGDSSALEFNQSGNDTYGCSFPGAVRSKQTVKFSRLNCKVNPAQGRDILIHLGEVTDFNGSGHDWNLSHWEGKIRVFVKLRLTGAMKDGVCIRWINCHYFADFHYPKAYKFSFHGKKIRRWQKFVKSNTSLLYLNP